MISKRRKRQTCFATISRHNDWLRVWSDIANPPSILPTVFGKFIKIGSFNRGLVRYEPPQVNAIVAVVTQFEPSMPLALGETIFLTLTSVEVLDGV